METEKHAGGRPPKYNTPEEMQAAIDAYFDGLGAVNPPTVTGLAYALGFESRHALLYYEHDKQEFLTTIKRAKMRIEQFLEAYLLETRNAAGPIFNLKNNFGWKDAQRLDINNEQDSAWIALARELLDESVAETEGDSKVHASESAEADNT